MPFAMTTALTAREVSFVADVGYDRVTKAFEERRVSNVAGRARERRLDLRGAFSLAAAERLKQYPAPVKRFIQGCIDTNIRQVRALSDVRDVDCVVDVVVTTFKASDLAKLIEERVAKLERMRELIIGDENVQAGAPTLKGTRIMARHIAGLVRNKVKRREIAEDFPEVTDEMIELAVLYDRLNPQRGRPVAKGRVE
jgi:uncharacterized protein (DUF433 family)